MIVIGLILHVAASYWLWNSTFVGQFIRPSWSQCCGKCVCWPCSLNIQTPPLWTATSCKWPTKVFTIILSQFYYRLVFVCRSDCDHIQGRKFNFFFVLNLKNSISPDPPSDIIILVVSSNLYLSILCLNISHFSLPVRGTHLLVHDLILGLCCNWTGCWSFFQLNDKMLLDLLRSCIIYMITCNALPCMTTSYNSKLNYGDCFLGLRRPQGKDGEQFVYALV